jgi:magnesium transporter
MTHPEDTGGGIMTSRLLSAGDNISVVEATELLRSADQDQEEIHAIYVVDADQRLVGVASLRSMLLASSDILMGSISDRKDIVSLTYLLWCRCLCLELGDLT